MCILYSQKNLVGNEIWWFVFMTTELFFFVDVLYFPKYSVQA